MDKTVKFRIKIETQGEKAFKTLEIDAQDLQKGVEEVTKSAKEVTQEFDKWTKGAIKINAIQDVIESVAASVNSLAQNYASFDTAMREANTMAGLDEAGFAEMKDEVADLGTQIGKTREELANGLYQVISNGVPKDNWISFLEQSAKASVGGLADLGQTVTVTSTLIKNYGLAWDAAAEIQDKIQTTAQNGVTSFEQLAAALPRVSGNAATLGVSIDELMASFATLTGVSGNTSEVSTQLAAVFTALVKPSSEAAQMAQQMGIQFDAAAIKAAGGFQNFLALLDASVKRYSAASGVLEQEVYGKLFGSAESLRALIPLTGELASKYEANVSAMADSTGATEAAFAQMNSTMGATQTMINNSIAAVKDWAGSILSTINPHLQVIAQLAQMVVGLKTFGDILNIDRARLANWTKALGSSTAASRLAAFHSRMEAMAKRILTAANISTTTSTWALNAAVTALYATLTLGISLAVTALATALSSLGDSADEASDSVADIDAATDAFTQTSSQTRAAIDMEIANLRQLISSGEDATSAINRLNTTYGDIFGQHATAAEWYDTLITKSRAYCAQLGYEAQARVIAQQKAQKELQLQQLQSKMIVMSREGKNVETHHYVNEQGEVDTYTSATDDWKEAETQAAALQKELNSLQSQFDLCTGKAVEAAKQISDSSHAAADAVDWQTMSWIELGKAIEAQKDKLGNAPSGSMDDKTIAAETAKLQAMQARHKQLGQKLGLLSPDKSQPQSATTALPAGSVLIENAASYEDLANNVQYYQRQIDQADASDKAAIETYSRQIAILRQKQQAIRDVQEAAELAASVPSVAMPSQPQEDPATLRDFDRAIARQRQLREHASRENIADIDAEILRLESLRRALDETSKQRFLRVEGLQNLRDLGEAARYLSEKLQDAAEGQIIQIAQQLDVIEQKQQQRQLIASVPKQQRQVSELSQLSKQELVVELRAIGIDGIQSKIKDLQKLLDQTNLPDDQRQEVKRLQQQWQSYEMQLRKSQASLSGAWGGTKQVVSGVQSVSDVLQGNVHGWQAVAAAIDASVAIAQGVQTVVSFVQALTAATTAETAASTANAVAKGSEAAAVGATAASDAATAATKTAAIVAIDNETAAWTALAASQYLSAHAAIPFAGLAIGSGYAATAEAIIAAARIPKFADGGLAYGPTLGIFGEYAGAKTNPEVVAPLDKLKTLIEPAATVLSGDLRFRLRGRDLVALFDAEKNLSVRRTGR